tara:strand:- start:1077 stop:1304 length:228 start_codon:yes stop_codon:yes gene_type:complete
MTNEEIEIKRQELCGEFWLDLREAIEAVGGDPFTIDLYADAPLSEFIELVAPNGIRPVFKRTGHIQHKKLPPEEE